MTPTSRKKPIVLCILDGWGIGNEQAEDNAIARARTPRWNQMLARYPHTELHTSGLDVGLPEGQMGNSEVGHMNIGSGRVVMQELPRIDQAVQDGSLATNPELQKFIATLKKTGGHCHLMGLLSDGGVHAHLLHQVALANIIAGQGVPVWVHIFADGRDTLPGCVKNYLTECRARFQEQSLIRFATISGRYYAMDRDNRWERVALAYEAIVSAGGPEVATPEEAVEQSYADGKTDEFILPRVVANYTGIQDNDAILMANFRTDRARQLLTALLDPNFSGFARSRQPKLSAALGMVEYSEALNRYMATLFKAQELNRSLPELIAEQGMTQLRIAETEKYAHVTFFFNGGREAPFAGEERILVPSPKVATYDLQPEMSAPEVTRQLLSAIASDRFDLIVVNYANTDMVGHTGDFSAAVKAVETLDNCLGQLADAVLGKDGILLITADHGNAEQMCDGDSHQPHTAHTTNPVPLLIVGDHLPIRQLAPGRLADIAPTILKLMGLKQPAEMTGVSLVQ